MFGLGSSGASARRATIQASIQAEKDGLRADAALEETKRLNTTLISKVSDQNKIIKKQNKIANQNAAKALEMASRPSVVDVPAAQPAPPAALLTGADAGYAGGGYASAEDESLAIKKRGRAGLRIDLNAPQTAGTTGIQVARG